MGCQIHDSIFFVALSALPAKFTPPERIQYSATAMLHHSITPSLYYSITHRSTTPLPPGGTTVSVINT
jgi:hypothetical protein